jgi:CCR4-NOT transcription complex subunit 1
LNQLSVVFGILITQILGFNFAEPGSWRTVFVVSFVLAVLQLLIGLRMVESPAWLAARNRKPEARAVSARLWKSSNEGDNAHSHSGAYGGDDAEEALLRERSPLPQPSQPPATVAQCFRTPELRRPLIIVSLAMLAQQISGKKYSFMIS